MILFDLIVCRCYRLAQEPRKKSHTRKEVGFQATRSLVRTPPVFQGSQSFRSDQNICWIGRIKIGNRRNLTTDSLSTYYMWLTFYEVEGSTLFMSPAFSKGKSKCDVHLPAACFLCKELPKFWDLQLQIDCVSHS